MTPLPLSDQLTTAFADAFESIGGDRSLAIVTPSQRPEFGHFQCNGAMPAAKQLRRKPREIAEEIVAKLQDSPAFAELTIAGPGFINVRLSDGALAELVRECAASPRLGIPADPEPKKVIVDYGGPNVAKPMHVGHLRSSIIGDSIVRLMRFMGHEVLGDIHLGDWGTQMGMLIVACKQRFPDAPYFDADSTGPYPEESPVTIADLQEMYPEISKACADSEELRKAAQQATVELQQGRPGYRALWQHFVDVSIAELKADFKPLGVEFDLWYGESAYDKMIPPIIEEMKANGSAVLDQGALIVHVETEEDKAPVPPLMLLKSDGGTNYATTDLATIMQRVRDLHADAILYVVDKRQSLHFEQVFRAARKSGIAPETAMEHLAFGTMNGKDGRPFKTRAGGVMRLADLIRMMTDEAAKRMDEAGVAEEYPAEERASIARTVGMAALKYADLMNVRSADYVFDIERFTKFEGRTGSYLLYAAVRIKSILRRAEEAGLRPGEILPPAGDAERDLMLVLLQAPDAIRRAAAERMPHHVAAYAYDLATAYTRFYNAHHIMNEQDAARQASWLGLSEFALDQLDQVLGLLGIRTPDRM